jgi:hypothetical protein
MTINQFRKILLAVIAVDACWFFITALLVHKLPPELVAYKNARDAARFSEGLRYQLFSLFEFFLVISWGVNFVGLYKLRPKSRPRFVMIHGIIYLLELSAGPEVMNSLVAFFYDLSELGHGLLLALIFWSPIAVYFKGDPKPVSGKV